MTESRQSPKLAILEAALEEELGGNAPPDLWERIVTRGESRPASRWWTTAALLLFGIAVLIAIATSRSEADSPKHVGPPDAPATLEEARERLVGDVSKLSVQADGVLDTSSGRTVPLYPDDLARLFASDTFDVKNREERDQVRRILAAAMPAAKPVEAPEWQYTLTIQCASKPVSVRIRGCAEIPEASPSGALELAIVGRDRLFILRPSSPLAEILRVDLIELTHQILRDGPLAVGITGLRTRRSDAKQLRCVGVGSDHAREFERFTKLRSLDIRESPELHDPLALAHVTDSVTSLTADAAHASPRLLQALGRLRSLDELVFTAPTRPILEMLTGEGAAAPIGDDDAILLTAWTELRELVVPGAPLTDRGLRTLAALTKLEALSLANCDGIDGRGFDAFGASSIERLNLIGCDALNAAGLMAIAALPKLDQLSMSIRPELDLSGLAASRSLRRLAVLGEPDATTIDQLGRLGSLERLTLASEIPAEALESLRAALPGCDVRVDVWDR